MSLAEQMLATMSESDDFVSYLADKEGHIVINESRIAIVPAELKTIAVTGDKDIETVTFDCVRYWDGNDLSTFAIYLNYVLPDKTVGTYIPEAIKTSEGEGVFHFDWKIKNNITTTSGKISFAITAVKTKQNENGETVVDKQWSSLPNGDCSIALGLGISNVPTEEESSDVVAQLSAILEQIHADVDEWIKTVVVQTTGTSQTQVMSQNAVTSSLNSYKEESIQQSNVYTDSKYNLLDKKILQNSNKISRDSKRITNLEQGLPDDENYTDATVAYTKDVPSNALPYAEVKKIGGMTYKDGNTLKSAKVTEVKSIGANLINLADKIGSYFVYEQTKIDSLPAGTYTFSCNHNIPANVGWWVQLYDASKTAVGGTGTLNYQEKNKSFTTTGTAEYISIYINAASVTVSNIMINKGSVAMPSAPYQEHTLPIPEAVQAIDGYGWGVNADCYNYIDWDKKQFVKCVGEVDMGMLNWLINSEHQFFAPLLYKTDYATNHLCAKYKTSASDAYISGEAYDKTISLIAGYIWVKDKDYTDAVAFKAAVQGVMLYYELATPEVTDISDLLPDDNFIEVEGDGSITAVNEYGYDVPSEIEYQLEV